MKAFDLKKFIMTAVGVVTAGAVYDLALHDNVLWGLYILAGLIVGGLVAVLPIENEADA